jgi:hypothetical protein
MREPVRFPARAFFVTVGRVGFERALATIETLAGRKPAALVFKAVV